MRTAALLLLPLCFSTVARADDKYGDQNKPDGPGEGNPIVPGLFADPSVARFGDTYYLYGTTDGFGWETGRWVVWKSTDFAHWHFSGESFPEITGKRNWAPGKPIFRGGKYWSPFTLNNDECRLAVADTPAGPWHDAQGKPLAKGIDGEIFVDDDGTPYLFYGNGDPGLAKLSPDLSKLDGPTTKVKFGHGYTEGEFLFKRRGVYYACAANLGYAEYRIIYMTSDKVTGPWHLAKQPFIIEPDPADHIWGTGHGNVVQLPGDDQWALVYLRSRMGEKVDPFQTAGNVYRQVCVERLTFNPDGTIKPVRPSRRGVGVVGTSTAKGTNLAAGCAATASSSRPGYEPNYAVDGGFGSRWIVSPDANGEAWWQVDLGRPRAVRRTELSFNYPTEVTPYTLEASVDGRHWRTLADRLRDTVHESPKVDRVDGEPRYLRVRFASAKSHQIPAGIWEFAAYDDAP